MKLLQEIEKLNPERFYIENVRSIMGVSTFTARLLCNMAVKDNYFKKFYAVECPKCSRIVKSFETKDEIPEKHTCGLCRDENEDEFEFLVSKNDIIIYYTLNK